MKSFTTIFTLVIVTMLAACTYQDENISQTYFDESPAQPPMMTSRVAPSYQTTCSNCQPTEYTVRTPVEVVYKNTTYRTVYVPQTTQSVSYEKRPYVAEEACNGNGGCPYQ